MNTTRTPWFWVILSGILLLYAAPTLSGAIAKAKPAVDTLQVTSDAFKPGQMIPDQYASCKGQANQSPSLHIDHVPEGTKSLAVIMDDPDAPLGTFHHWLVWNISPQTRHIAKNTVPTHASVGKNSFNHTQYDGPCPPFGQHRYEFHVYALDNQLSLKSNAKHGELVKAMKGHILAQGQLTGHYKK